MKKNTLLLMLNSLFETSILRVVTCGDSPSQN